LAWKQKFATEEIHLDLTALVSAIVHDAILADRSCFGRPRRIDVVCDVLDPVITESGMTKFVAH
jgi:hypothetical protein